MKNWNRALTTLFAAAAAGFLLWLAAQFNMQNTGGYWAALGVVAGCGLLLGLAQLRGSGGNPRAMLLLDFMPVLVCAGWILIYAEPDANWFRDHVSRWSGDIGIGGVVHDVATFNGVRDRARVRLHARAADDRAQARDRRGRTGDAAAATADLPPRCCRRPDGC